MYALDSAFFRNVCVCASVFAFKKVFLLIFASLRLLSTLMSVCFHRASASFLLSFEANSAGAAGGYSLFRVLCSLLHI